MEVTMIQSAWRMNITATVMRHGKFSSITLAALKVLILTLLLGAAGARADTFNIVFTFVEGLSGSGSFMTDANCSICTLGAGLLTFTADIPPDTGVNAFDLVDEPGNFSVTFNRPQDLLNGFLFSSESDDQLTLRTFTIPFVRTLVLLGPPDIPDEFFGSFTINAAPPAVPEPSSVILLVSVVAMVGLLTRRRRRAQNV
jgi:hypothetical protein